MGHAHSADEFCIIRYDLDRRIGTFFTGLGGDLRKFVNAHRFALGEDHGAENRVFQLPHIAGPAVGNEHLQRLRLDRAHALSFFRRETGEEMPRKFRNVLGPRPQRRHHDREDVQTIEQVFPESSRLHVGDQIAVGGGNDAHVHLDGLARADRLDLALLQARAAT